MDPEVNLGPLAMERQKTKLYSQLERAMKEGEATMAYGDLNYKIGDSEL